MNESEALREIRRVARTGLIIFSPHAQRRMEERNVKFSDVRHALRNATRVTPSAPDQASDWTATGPDVAGEE
ncbi:MAG: DUF4258 domain-containing protein, partial [Deltaproteobacteria bacterium]|nr:DUF4258 domain-containing protein [Deltaproteobacteria bacterium]